MSETAEKAPTSASLMKSPADAEDGKKGLRFQSKFNDAEYDRWRKALDAKRARKSTQ